MKNGNYMYFKGLAMILIIAACVSAQTVLLDNFEQRAIDDLGNTGYTNQNALALRGISNAGTWYAYASDNGAKVIAYDEIGTEEVITTAGPSDGAYSSTEASMLKVLGTDKMIAAIDALEAVESGTDYYGAIETPFLVTGSNAKSVDLSNLTSVAIKGRIKGALQITIESPAVTDWAQWGWTISSSSLDWDDIDIVLQVAEMTGPGWQLVPSTPKNIAMAQANVFSLQLNTSHKTMGTRVDFEIESIYLIFEGGVPAEFGEGDPSSISKNFATKRNANLASFAGINNGEISLNLKAGSYTAELYNTNGRMIRRSEINATNGVNATGLRTDNLAKGVFVLNVKQAGVSVLKHKITVK